MKTKTGIHHRICILGNSGSGKSTLAKALGEALNIPVFHLDRELLHGNFQRHPMEKRIELQQALVDQDDWVIDGNYDTLLPQRIERATLVIFLNVSRFVSIPRVLHRNRKGGQAEDTVPDGANPQGISWEFLKWIAGYNRKQRIKYMVKLCNELGVNYLLVQNAPILKQVELIMKTLQK